MIELPDFEKSFEYENNFYWSCDITRISKLLAHYEIYKMAKDIPGAIVECGVFKGASLLRFAMFRELFENPFSKKILGFDTFDKFPETKFSGDIELLEKQIATDGQNSISTEQLHKIFAHKGIDRYIELIEGDITKTVPEYVEKHPELKISILNLDTDVYEPAVTIMEYLYPRIIKGGILMIDDYGEFPGENKAVDDYFKDKNIKIRKFPFCMTPSYVVKQ